jgi:hypothetical protein
MLEAERGRASRRPLSLQANVSPLRTADMSNFGRTRSPVSPIEAMASARRRVLRSSSPRASDSFVRPVSRRIVLSEDGNSQNATVSSRKTTERYHPITQHSLMRAKSPSDVQSPPTRVVSSPIPPGRAFSPVLPLTYQSAPQSSPGGQPMGRPSHDSANAPPPSQRLSAYVEAEERAYTPSKPGFLRRVKDRISSDSSKSSMSRPGTSAPHIAVPSMTPQETRPSSSTSWHRKNRSKSSRMSSGMIYYNPPK